MDAKRIAELRLGVISLAMEGYPLYSADLAECLDAIEAQQKEIERLRIKAGEKQCPECDGTGYVSDTEAFLAGERHRDGSRECRECQETGYAAEVAGGDDA